MMNRRSFLKSLAAGAVAAAVPLPISTPIELTGTITAYFKSPETYKYFIGLNHLPYPNMWPGEEIKEVWLNNKQVWP